MFKKDVGVKNFSNLKNTERRGLVNGYPSYDTPSVVKKSVFKNLAGKGTVYTDERLKPIWFKLNDDDRLVPTVFTLWENPGLIPVVKTHDIVIYDHIIGGADLMLPGTVPPFGTELTKGTLVSIVSTTNDLVSMAVGYLTLDLAGKERVVGTSGVAVKVLHYYKDELYKSYDAEKLDIPRNEDLIALLKVPESVDEQIDTTTADADSAAEEQAGPETVLDPEEEPESQPQVDVNDAAETLSELSMEDVDHFFHRSLLYSLTQDSIETPISSSNFMSNHIIKNLPIDSNIKKTSYKKTAKWLKHLEKAGYLKLKGKGDDLIVVDAIKKDHNEELRNFVPYRIKKPVSNTASSTAQKPSGKPQLQIVNYYKPQQRTKLFFEKVGQSFFDYYTQPELKKLLEQFIKQEQLVSPKNPKQIVINDALGTVIKSKDSSTIARDKIFAEFLGKNFSKFYQVTYLNGKKSDFFRGELPKVKIIMETPMGNKQITRIQIKDFEIYDIQAKQFNNELKTKCSSSTTTTDTLTMADGSHNPKGYYEIMVQGAHEKIVIDLLTKQYGLSVSWFEVENKLKNRRKKR